MNWAEQMQKNKEVHVDPAKMSDHDRQYLAAATYAFIRAALDDPESKKKIEERVALNRANKQSVRQAKRSA